MGEPKPESAQMLSAPVPVIRVRPPTRLDAIELAELWEYRELLFFLAWRDVKVRYKQTALGAAWAILQPVLTMVVFSVFFGRLAGVPSNGVPYPVFVYVALLPWQLFAHVLADSSSSLINNERLITKVYFPRVLIPMSSVIASLPDFAISFVVLLGLLAWYGITPGLGVLTLPIWLALALVTAFGAGLLLSALNVRYRDVRYTMPFLTQLWLFLTPVAYPSSIVPEAWRPLFGLNPLAGVVEGFRWALLGTPLGGSVVLLCASALAALALLAGGYAYFRRFEAMFADVI
jgi:lipopolysaccharide transport system permease protein